MLFQLRTDNHITNSEELAAQVRTDVEAALLPRLAEQLRRVEVYLQDTNSHKRGVDLRCSIEAHLAGHQPVVAHGTGTTIDQAVDSGIDRLLAALEHTLGRLEHKHGRTPMGGPEER